MNRFTITGQIISKKNTWRKNRWGSIYQSKQKELNDIIWQLKEQKKEPTIENDVFVKIIIRGNNRRDMMNELETLADCLQASGIIKNDRQIKEIHGKKVITKENIGADIEITTCG